MSTPVLSFAFSLLLLLAFSTTAEAQKWTNAKNKGGVDIKTRFIEGWSTKQYRGSVTVKTTLAEAVDVYRDPVKRKKYMKRSIEVSNLKVVSKNEIITYNLGDAPWPVTDRDNITRSVFTTPSPDVVLVTMTSLPDFIPAKSGVVRIPRTKGYWRFTDLKNGTVKIELQSVADLGGSVPDWVVNSVIVDGPFETLSAMRDLLEKK